MILEHLGLYLLPFPHTPHYLASERITSYMWGTLGIDTLGQYLNVAMDTTIPKVSHLCGYSPKSEAGSMSPRCDSRKEQEAQMEYGCCGSCLPNHYPSDHVGRRRMISHYHHYGH